MKKDSRYKIVSNTKLESLESKNRKIEDIKLRDISLDFKISSILEGTKQLEIIRKNKNAGLVYYLYVKFLMYD